MGTQRPQQGIGLESSSSAALSWQQGTCREAYISSPKSWSRNSRLLTHDRSIGMASVKQIHAIKTLCLQSCHAYHLHNLASKYKHVEKAVSLQVPLFTCRRKGPSISSGDGDGASPGALATPQLPGHPAQAKEGSKDPAFDAETLPHPHSKLGSMLRSSWPTSVRHLSGHLCWRCSGNQGFSITLVSDDRRECAGRKGLDLT